MTLPQIHPQWYPTDVSDEVVEDIVPTTAEDEYPQFFPGYVGVSADNSFTDARPGGLFMADYEDAQGRNIDRESHGEMGEVNRNAYSIYGPVEPNSVENFALMGQVSNYRRPAESGNGPVGRYDHAGYTAAQIVQQMSPEAYTEASLISLLTEGI